MKLRSIFTLVVSVSALVAHAGSASAADLPPLPEQQGGPRAEPAAPSAAGPTQPAAQAPAPAPSAPPPVLYAPAPAPATAGAAAPEPRDQPAARAVFIGDPNKMWFLSGSVRETYVGSRGYDPYSGNDALPQWTFAASRTVLSRGRFSFAAGAAWDVGGSSATSRGLDAGILANRFAATAEGRYHPSTWAYGFVRLSPGANVVNARVNDPSAPGTLTTTQWSFSGEGSIGAAVTPMIVPGGPRVWLTPEIGYSYATSTQMRLAPKNEKDITGTSSKTDLGELALSGVYFRVGLGLSF